MATNAGPGRASPTRFESFLHWTYLDTFGPHPDRSEDNLGLPLEKHLSNFHSQMIAVGGAIGTGFLIGSGEALAIAGPLPLLCAFAYVGLAAYLTIYSLGELATLYPVAGSFVAFSSRFVDQAWGAAMGWNYAVQWLTVLPLELVAASMTLQYWGSTVRPAAWVAIFLFLILAINVLGVRGYGNFEAFFSLVKIAFIIGFLIFGILFDLGIGWDGAAIGAKNWYDPGAANGGGLGLCSVMVVASFAYSGTELVGLTAAEMQEPIYQLPRAVRSVFFRITLFYIGGTLMIGLLVPFTNPNLIGQNSFLPAISKSPFVIAILNAKIRALPSIVNAVVLMTTLSVANSSVYGSTRPFSSMAFNGQAPKFFAYIDTQGRPMCAIALALAFGCLAFLAELPSNDNVFTWLLSISGLSVMITWSSVCGAHIQFRRAWVAQDRSLDDLPFRSPFGIKGSILGLAINLSILLMQFIVAIKPVNHASLTTSRARASAFFQAFLAVPLVVILYGIYKLWHKTVAKDPLMTVATHSRICEICSIELRSHEDDGHENRPETAVLANVSATAQNSSLTQRCAFIDLTAPQESIYSDGGSEIIEDEIYRKNRFEEWCSTRYQIVQERLRFPWQ